MLLPPGLVGIWGTWIRICPRRRDLISCINTAESWTCYTVAFCDPTHFVWVALFVCRLHFPCSESAT